MRKAEPGPPFPAGTACSWDRPAPLRDDAARSHGLRSRCRQRWGPHPVPAASPQRVPPSRSPIVSLDFAAVAAETSSLGTPQCTWQEASPAGTGVSRHPASAGSTRCGRHPAHEAHLCTEES